MSNFCGRRFLSVLVGALTVLGSHVASAVTKIKKDDVIVGRKGATRGHGRESAAGRLHKRRRNKAVIRKKGKADARKHDKKLKRLRKIRGIKWNKILKFVKTPLGTTVGIGSVASLGVASYYGASWLFGGKDVPKKAVSEVPSFFSNLSDKEKGKFIDAIGSFGLKFDGKFKGAVEKLSFKDGGLDGGLYNFGWGKFRATGDGFVCAVGKGGLESHAELIIDVFKADMSCLSKEVLSLLFESISVPGDVLAGLFTVCWVYAKYNGIFAYSTTVGLHVDVDRFLDKAFQSEIVGTYNEIKEWVKSCLEKKV